MINFVETSDSQKQSVRGNEGLRRDIGQLESAVGRHEFRAARLSREKRPTSQMRRDNANPGYIGSIERK